MLPATSNGHGLPAVTGSHSLRFESKAATAGYITVAVSDSGGQVADQPHARLLTTSCTTGWRDWVHGTLWLCSDGLLRISLGLRTTLAKGDLAGAAQYEKDAREQFPVHDFTGADIRELVRQKKTNVWAPWRLMRSAAIRYGISADRLRITLHDGRTVKFLWLPDRVAMRTLRPALESNLGASLHVQGVIWRRE